MGAFVKRSKPLPPKSISAGYTEVVSMVRPGYIPARRARWLGGAGILAAFLLVGAADARTRLPEPGPWQDGDPTADDQPSPTPKNRSYGIATGSQSGRHEVRNGNRPTERLIWLSYVRALIRITVR